MATSDGRDDRELVLTPNTYAFVLDRTKGRVTVFVGPTKTSLSETDQLVTYNDKDNKFASTKMDAAISPFQLAVEGEYIVLSNPSKTIEGPRHGGTSDAVELEFGRKTNIHGPTAFPLWPGQVAKTIPGHRLRNNQFLLVRVYDEQAAMENWQSAIIKPALDGSTSAHRPTLTMGQLLIIKGTEVSFFMPPTGIEVVPDVNGQYVRDAVTIERLEYCVLLCEDGNKRYVRGPAVVFPEPTETFVEDSQHDRKFDAIELNPNSGLYIKVIADYDENGNSYKVGDEIFLKGTEQAIYFPRPEHSIIEYDGKQIHYAIAIPAGEGRYVLDRNTGEVTLVTGPKMFLPDPRTQVIVRRVLNQKQVELMYPGNTTAQSVNAQLEHELAEAKGDFLESRGYASSSVTESLGSRRRLFGASASMGDTFKRSTTYTPPRTITLDTKYDGAVGVSLWPGYAVLVTNKTGNRRVELGPKVFMLNYDENLIPLILSTGKPKTTDKLFETVYLRVRNNVVSDLITVETEDLVSLNIKLSYRANFVGDNPEVWFEVENYVKFATDHMRSVLKNNIKRTKFEAFYEKASDIIRDIVLGKKIKSRGRAGRLLTECQLDIYDVEILSVTLVDRELEKNLINSRLKEIQAAMASVLEEVERKMLMAREETTQLRHDLEITSRTRALEIQDRIQTLQTTEAQGASTVAAIHRALDLANATQRLEITSKENEDSLTVLQGETDEFVKRAAAVNGELAKALNNLSDRDFAANVVKHLGGHAAFQGMKTIDVLNQMFEGTALSGMIESLAKPANKG